MEFHITVELSTKDDLKVLELMAIELGLCELHTAETIAQMALEEAIVCNKHLLSDL